MLRWTITRSVDMQICPWLKNAPNAMRGSCGVQIGIFKHQHRRLATELKQGRLQMLRRMHAR